MDIIADPQIFSFADNFMIRSSSDGQRLDRNLELGTWNSNIKPLTNEGLYIGWHARQDSLYHAISVIQGKLTTVARTR